MNNVDSMSPQQHSHYYVSSENVEVLNYKSTGIQTCKPFYTAQANTTKFSSLFWLAESRKDIWFPKMHHKKGRHR